MDICKRKPVNVFYRWSWLSKFFSLSPMVNLPALTMDGKKNVTSWTSTGISPEKMKPCDFCLALIMSNLGNGGLQQSSSSLCSNSMLNLHSLWIK